ncbi:lamin tail domain-containing protein [Kordia sp.]|uniref:lamin tail domain-containing protein n=1 Tax=Kordia sp. TaxID=1965332 RepID=UPI003D2A7760
MKKKITTLVCFFLMCFVGYSQILTFEFNGLVGNEASATSNSNDANLSNSTITRGSGLTASNNGNRFNATSWASTSIANAISGNDYMEFTITPNIGFEFSVTTMVFNVQRSNTGLRGIALRSSIDSYAANIDTEMAIADNTSVQTITFTVNQTGNTAAVTYRIYGWAEGGAGSGGFEGTGDDITVNGTVVSSCTDAMNFTNVQFPTTSQTITFGDNFTVFAQGYEPGVTEAAGAGTGVEAWIGYNTINNDPSVDAGWTWIPATFNVQAGNNDEFSAEIGSGLATGTHYYASRFRLNNCLFTYGGSGGDWNNDSIQLTVNPDIADFCNVDFPKTATTTEGDTFNVYAHVYEPGITDAAGQGANVEAWIGYNTTDNDPSVGAGWTWVAATYDTDVGNNDQYTAEIGSARTPGTYYYASRFRINGSDFTYGGILADNMGNFWDAVTYNSGILTVNAPPTANVVITEIMYNSTGTDDEWVEICNNSGSTQSLSLYTLDANGSTLYTFSGGQTIADGTCITIGVGSNGDGNFNPGCNFTPDFGLNGSINNSNNLANTTRTITLFAADGTTVADAVTYDNGDGADGNGSSLHVTDITMDNSDTGTNWQEVTDGGSPGTNSLVSPCATTEVAFVATSSTLAEDGLFIDVCVAITNPSGSTATTVEIALDGASTATNGTDYDDGAGIPAAISFPVTLTFPAGSTANQCLTIFISNDDAVVEPSETVILNLQNVAGGTTAAIGTNTTHTLTITDNDGAGSSDIMITQYYEGTMTNKWIEVKNISGAIIPANTYYIVVLNNADADTPATADPSDSGSLSFNNNVLISTDMAIDEVRRYKHDTAVLPAYASPGETGYDGNPTTEFPSSASLFNGDDLVIITTTVDSNSWANRVDVIGDGTSWGLNRTFVRNSCVSSGPSVIWSPGDWVEFTNSEVENAVVGTNPYLGEHEEGVTSWNGSAWSNGTPERSRIVSLAGNYNATTDGDLVVCSLTVDSGVTLTIPSGAYIDIENDLTVNTTGIVNINHEGSLIMVEDAGSVTLNGTGIINVEKTTTPYEQYDYTYWSSPVASTTFAAGLSSWRLDRAYSYIAANYADLDNDEIDDDNNIWNQETSTNTMTPGVGYAVMGPTTGVFPRTESVMFSGAVNNGVITTPISLSADATDTDDDWNFVGNPYPSAISADDFVALNTNITGTLYFWTHVNDVSVANPGPNTFNYSTDDYAMYNTVGGIGGSSSTSGSSAPTGFIASGQGFFLQAITAGTVTFNNSMRSNTYSNNDFFRPNDAEDDTTVEKDRVWLQLTNNDGVFSELLIGFFDDATLQRDRLYDGIRIKGVNYVSFYSKDATAEYGIQGRPTFTVNDIVPLGYDSQILGDLTIGLGDVDGVLNTTNIYLKDLDLNIIHDLKISDYTFTTTDGVFQDRFQLQFVDESTLSVDEVLNEDAIAVYVNNNNELEIKQRTRLEINSVTIYSMIGAKIISINDMNQKISLNEQASGVYIVVIDTEKGTLTKKITR